MTDLLSIITQLLWIFYLALEITTHIYAIH